MKPVQLFSIEYVDRCADMTPLQIARFLDDFRKVHAPQAEHRTVSKLISMRVPEDLLYAFKTQAQLQGRPYQAVIKELMRKWLIESDETGKISQTVDNKVENQRIWR